MKFCEKLKQLRIEKGLTQEQLAKELYISRSAVAKWEQGRGYPSLEMLEKIANIFNFSIDELLDEKEYHSVTIENNQAVKNHTKYYKIGIIISCIVFLSLSVLFALYFVLKNTKIETENWSDCYVYCKVKKEEEGLRLICVDTYYDNCDAYIGKEYFLSNDTHVSVKDKYNQSTTIEALKDEYIVRYSFALSNKNNTYPHCVDIIDDYIEGEYNVHGFFISSELIDYLKAPVLYNYDPNDELLNYKGEEESLSYRYPAVLEYQDGSSNHGNLITKTDSSILDKSKYIDTIPIKKHMS